MHPSKTQTKYTNLHVPAWTPCQQVRHGYHGNISPRYIAISLSPLTLTITTQISSAINLTENNIEIAHKIASFFKSQQNFGEKTLELSSSHTVFL